MHKWIKKITVLIGSCVLLGCAATSDDGAAAAQSSSMKMAAGGCMSEVETARQQCEKECPTATGNEHFSMQHKIAMEHAACKERCSDTSEQKAMSCRGGST